MSIITLNEKEHGEVFCYLFGGVGPLVLGVPLLFLSIGMAGTHIFNIQVIGCPIFLLACFLCWLPFNVSVTKW